jgi:hypothetical protein
VPLLEEAVGTLAESLGVNLGFVKGLVGGNVSSAILHTVSTNLASAMVRRGFSANAALAQLQSVGAGIRRADFLDIFRTGRRAVQVQDSVRTLTSGDTLTPDMYREAPFYTPRRYTALVETWYYDPLTGRLTSQVIPVAARPGWSVATVKQRALDFLNKGGITGESYAAGFGDWQSITFRVDIIDLFDRGE